MTQCERIIRVRHRYKPHTSHRCKREATHLVAKLYPSNWHRYVCDECLVKHYPERLFQVEKILRTGPIKCTAWDLVGKYSELVDNTHKIKVGRTFYFGAFVTKYFNSVRVERIETTTHQRIRVITRYLPPDAQVELVEI